MAEQMGSVHAGSAGGGVAGPAHKMQPCVPQAAGYGSWRYRADFFVPGAPVAWARPRRAKAGHFYTQAEQESARDRLVLLSKRHRPRAPLEGPVAVQLRFVLPIPSGWAAWRQEAAGRERIAPTGRPDIDNTGKLVVDALTRGGWWRDDAQITALDLRKRYARPGERPGTEVVVEELAAITSAIEWREIRAEYAAAAGGGS